MRSLANAMRRAPNTPAMRCAATQLWDGLHQVPRSTEDRLKANVRESSLARGTPMHVNTDGRIRNFLREWRCVPIRLARGRLGINFRGARVSAPTALAQHKAGPVQLLLLTPAAPALPRAQHCCRRHRVVARRSHVRARHLHVHERHRRKFEVGVREIRQRRGSPHHLPCAQRPWRHARACLAYARSPRVPNDCCACPSSSSALRLSEGRLHARLRNALTDGWPLALLLGGP